MTVDRSIVNAGSPSAVRVAPRWTWRCPTCNGPVNATEECARCPACDLAFPKLGGIWRFLPTTRQYGFDEFLGQYSTVRAAEGWGASEDEYYRALPYVSPGDPQAAIWRIRARSFQALRTQVDRLHREVGRSLRVVDLGSGNCWLADRLGQLGHDVVAVDISLNARDGLGASAHFRLAGGSATPAHFTAVQADYDHLPVADAEFDLVVFNGSFHYSSDADVTIHEALRVLRDDGRVVVMDSPVYRRATSGDAMVRRRESRFSMRFGFTGSSRQAEGYLSDDRIRSLVRWGVRWDRVVPGAAWRRAIHRLVDAIWLSRDDATFPLLIGTRPGAGSIQPPTPGLFPHARQELGRTLLRWHFRLVGRRRLGRIVVEQVAGRPIVVLPHVFNPALFRSGSFLANALNSTLIPPNATVLDLGTGSGVGAIVAAEWAARVDAVDINPAAVRCARLNALLNHVDDQVRVREGDLFAPVAGERFDVILFNPPYYRGVPRDAADRAWRSVDVVDRFAAEVADHLTPTGRALVALSTDGETASFLREFRRHELAIDVAAQRAFLSETFTLYRVRPHG